MIPSSLHPLMSIHQDEVEYAFVRAEADSRLAVLAPRNWPSLPVFDGQANEQDERTLLLCPLTSQNAIALRDRLEWLKPQLLGLKTSAGLGDRLGLATTGHIRAIRDTQGKVAPIFAQQSMREMGRTGRTPQQVMDEAMWGVFAENWQEGFGADADHLKTPEDIDQCLAAGFTFFTIDPGAQVDNRAETASLGELKELATQLPTEVRPAESGLEGRSFEIEELKITFDEVTLFKAAVKYGRAIAHVAAMYHHLEATAGTRPFEVEVSVDETDQPTSHAEHLYVVSELTRLGVKWVSLAPRFIGRFEKGVDYIGDLGAFEADYASHAAISRAFGGYKISLHSGSDKFSIYPIASRLSQGRVHLKTAGTSYLEALRTLAAVDLDLFQHIYTFARGRYETDKVSYHVSAQLGRAPLPESVMDWPGLLDQFDAREIFHVTFGSVLTEKDASGGFIFRERLYSDLRDHAEVYASNLRKHFNRHLEFFAKYSAA
jgi:hypothetical protein